MTTTPQVRRHTFSSRILGFAADVILFALFLLAGLTGLNILVQGIVLAVGILAPPPPDFSQELLDLGIITEAPEVADRLAGDIAQAVIAVVQFALAGLAYWGFLRLRRRYMHLFGDPGFELFVSKRYLIAREGGRLVSLITIISVLGVAVGVMALIVVISVMEGFDQALVRRFMGVFSHVQVTPHPRLHESREISPMRAERILEFLEAEDYVVAAAPIYEHRTVIVRSPGDFNVAAFAQIRGIDPERERHVSDFLEYVSQGKAEPADGEIVLGERLAERLRVFPGDTVYGMGKSVSTATSYAIKWQPFRVVGLFHSGLYDVDDGFAFTTIPTMHNMMITEDTVTAIHLKVTEPRQVNRVLPAIHGGVPQNYAVYTWQMLNPEFFKALWMEKVAMFIILLLIVLVASFNIVGTLVMTVVQKTRDIGVLKSMGASRTAVLKIFLLHGFLVGLLGTSLGVVWGLRLCRFVEQDIDKIFQLPGGVYGLDRLPVVVDPFLIGFMAVCAMAICVLASIIPAMQAARLNPVEALRYD